jgi:hypothetical protein
MSERRRSESIKIRAGGCCLLGGQELHAFC